MKLSHYHDYSAGHTELCEKALVTAWNLLADYEEYLVLIGGLVPRYLCTVPTDEPQASTMDVDLGLSLAVRGTATKRIGTQLACAGFKTKPDPMPPGTLPLAKFYRRFDKLELKTTDKLLWVVILMTRPLTVSPCRSDRERDGFQRIKTKKDTLRAFHPEPVEGLVRCIPAFEHFEGSHGLEARVTLAYPQRSAVKERIILCLYSLFSSFVGPRSSLV